MIEALALRVYAAAKDAVRTPSEQAGESKVALSNQRCCPVCGRSAERAYLCSRMFQLKYVMCFRTCCSHRTQSGILRNSWNMPNPISAAPYTRTLDELKGNIDTSYHMTIGSDEEPGGSAH